MNQENEIEMKAAENKKPKKEINKKHNQLKKIDLETARTLEQIKDKVNKKSFGRKIRDTEIIHIALGQINSDIIKHLQESTYSEKDRLAMAHEEYQKKHGKLSLDQFIGLLLKHQLKNQ